MHTVAAFPQINYMETDEDRTQRALDAMLAFETMLEHIPAQTAIPAKDIHTIASLVHETVRDVLLWAPPVANDMK